MKSSTLIIRTAGNSSITRDRAITKEFNHFVEKRDKNRPFFSFLFYDAVHNYCEQTTPDYKPFQPAVEQCDRFSLTPHSGSDPIPYVNRYHNAVYFVDNEVQKVLDSLKAHDLLKNTVLLSQPIMASSSTMNIWGIGSMRMLIPLINYIFHYWCTGRGKTKNLFVFYDPLWYCAYFDFDDEGIKLSKSPL